VVFIAAVAFGAVSSCLRKALRARYRRMRATPVDTPRTFAISVGVNP